MCVSAEREREREGGREREREGGRREGACKRENPIHTDNFTSNLTLPTPTLNTIKKSTPRASRLNLARISILVCQKKNQQVLTSLIDYRVVLSMRDCI